MAQVTEYRGALLNHVYRGDPVSATCAVDRSGKLVYEGPYCVDHLTNSYRYGEEAHIIIYQKEEPKYVLREALSRDWNRIECHLPVWQKDQESIAWLSYRGYTVTYNGEPVK